jgi:hypothetical protein
VRGALWAKDLTRQRRPEPSSHDYVLVEVQPDRLVRHLARATCLGESSVLDRLHRGCRAFAAWDWRDEVVSWLWVSTRDEWAPPIRRLLRLAEGDCYGWGAGTVEDHRGRGLFGDLLEHAGWQMAEEGCRTLWGGILDSNVASQLANARAGMRPVLRLLAILEPAPARLATWPADYADSRMVEPARRLLGAQVAADLAGILAPHGWADGSTRPALREVSVSPMREGQR